MEPVCDEGVPNPPIGYWMNGKTEAMTNAAELQGAIGNSRKAVREVVGVGDQRTTLVGCLGFAVAWAVADGFKGWSATVVLLLFIGCCGGAMTVCDLILNRRLASITDETLRPSPSIIWSRVTTKLWGMWGTVTLLGVGYWFIPEYSKETYQPVWQAVVWAIGPAGVISIIYAAWLDGRLANPFDGCWQAGRLLSGQWTGLDWKLLRQYALGWVVKGFFLPLMLSGAAEHYVVLRERGVDFSTFGELYSTVFNLLLTIDITYGAIGYLLTLRLTDSQIRSVDRTWLGWVAALCCYAPFSGYTWGGWLDYGGATSWTEWLADSPVLLITWGFAILGLHTFYAWSTASFGIRFSNLTNRGIITHGPYRFFKHPAYFSKNLAWWLMAVPFVVTDSWGEAVRRCACLLATNGIYALRAWTEERHLLSDPTYREYSAWMREYSVWAQFCRWFRRS